MVNDAIEARQEKLKGIFFPYAARKQRELPAAARFVYYTSAATAVSILKNRQIWMRNTTTMNDFMEVGHGVDCLKYALKSDAGAAFNAALDACFPGLAKEVDDLFQAWLPRILQETFVTCLSEHLPTEDKCGRLSMWRAYGGSSGVAMVLNGGFMHSKSLALSVYTSVVGYLDKEGFANEFAQVANNIAREADFIRGLGRDPVKNLVFIIFLFSAICTKHPGFHEEREWRIVSSSALQPSKLVLSSVEIVRGIPQKVLKIELRDYAEEGLIGLALPKLLDRIVIGPCEFPEVMRNAFHGLLADAGVSESEKKVIVSDIPLRYAQHS